MKAIQKVMMLSALVSAMCFSSCSSDEEMNVVSNGEVRFAAGIGQQAVATQSVTRAAGTTWEAGDKIGIFMVRHGETTIAESASNKKFTTATGDGNFTPVIGQEIYYPMDVSPVDFIAYYPHADNATLDTDLPVTIATAQTTASQATCDLLWACANGTSGNGYNKESTSAVALTFGHCLTKITMNCKLDASVGVSNLDAATVTIKGMNARNTFDLKTGTLGTPAKPTAITPRKLAAPVATYAATYDAIILPATYTADVVSVDFGIGNETFTWDVKATTFKPGTEYIYEVTIRRTGVTAEGTITPWSPVTKDPVTAE
ncbi:fimbrillin family protein [uncultured Bacteroides sp.]|uniref:fimbrillin family protein n=1 Tax=uncultured Bacteroides sp. TaxID=162156 RepID=UPI0025DAA419|nr:fimbrillin family protein [uncultured Bacteroides sp.]